MDYLRRSTLNEERHKQAHIDQFDHQQRQVKRAEQIISVIQARLVELGVVRNSTVLSCDWMDDTNMPFEPCPLTHEHDQQPCARARGCHEPVEQGGDFELLQGLLRERGGANSNDDSSSGGGGGSEDGGGGSGGSGSISSSAMNLDCFNSVGEPQGCHAYAMQRLAQARFRVGCSRIWYPWLWGWCGKYPWSALLLRYFHGPKADAYSSGGGAAVEHGGRIDSKGQVYHGYPAGCTTLWDIFSWILDKGYEYSALALVLASSANYFIRSINGLQRGVDAAKAGVRHLEERASGEHSTIFVNRVSLSLNLLLDSSELIDQDDDNDSNGGDDGGKPKYKMKLLPRTLWERDLQEIVSDPDQRQRFRAAVRTTTKQNTRCFSFPSLLWPLNCGSCDEK